MLKTWDIFCKVVDNFGDIGVCWRLAKQLQREHGLQVRLWVDDLSIAQHLIPALDLASPTQYREDICIQHWHAHADFSQAADVVIEGFACGLPSAYLAVMVTQQSKWVNLEYLSAESWVDDFHGKPSPQSFLNSNHSLVRYFYFPGFTEKSGGLIREGDAFNQHVSSSWNTRSTLKISLFCYPSAPISDLLNALQSNTHGVIAYVPKSAILPNIAKYFGKEVVEVGEKLTKNNLTVEVLPFLSQADYDALLRVCDLNFVRGEDSWVRAIWAAKPFIWQPYWQEEDTHLKKLLAFLDVFYRDAEAQVTDTIQQLEQAWVQSEVTISLLNTYLKRMGAIQLATQNAAQRLANQTDLAAKLVIFCNKV
ncbi:MAG: elongation factor P maturation arginine rhamnosyltransferase EarP [Methylophilus sp.]|nr:elongation factor P maturation arginine rhamnosyltransferase EarP [Methylophilus sp.]